MEGEVIYLEKLIKINYARVTALAEDKGNSFTPTASMPWFIASIWRVKSTI